MQLDDLQRFINRRVIRPSEVVGLGNNVVKERIDWIEIQSVVGFGQSLRVVSLHDEQVAIPLVRSGIIGIQFNGAAQFLLGGGQVPVVTHGHVAKDGMSFSESGIELQGPLGGLARSWFGLSGGHSVVGHLTQNRGRPRETRVGFRVRWILADGFLKKCYAASQVEAAAQGEFALMVGVTGLSNLGRGGVNGSRPQRGRRLWRQRKSRQNLPCDGGGDVRFHL